MRGVICWDLDETLGYVRPLEGEILAELRAAQRGWWGRWVARWRGAPAGPPVCGREGIEAALGRLGEGGFVQVVTTAGFRIYAERALERLGIAGHFAAVFSREDLWTGRGKRYGPVLERFGVGPERALIVGDSFERDRGEDHPGVVMICEEDGYTRPARTIPPLVEALAHAEGFRAGFEELLERARCVQLARRVRVGRVEASIEPWGDYRRPAGLTPVLSALKWVEDAAGRE